MIETTYNASLQLVFLCFSIITHY